MDAFVTAILGDDLALEMDSEHQPPDPFSKFLERVELQKSMPAVADESWSAPMESPVEAALDKMFASATSAVEKFLEIHGRRLGSERLPWSDLRQFFREELQCQQ